MFDWPSYRAQLDRFLTGANSIAVVVHVGPDPDAIGSLLGATHILTDMGKIVYPCVDAVLSEKWNWMPGIDRVRNTIPTEKVDRLLVLDVSSPERLGLFQPMLEKYPSLLIDHHKPYAGTEKWADVRLIKQGEDSTAQMLYQIFALPPAAAISPAAATCLSFALLGDTLVYSSESTYAQTLLTGGHLQLLKADKQSELARRVVAKEWDQWRLASLANAESKKLAGGQALYAEVTQEMAERLGIDPKVVMHADVANGMLIVRGPKLFVAVHERALGDCKISVRSIDPYNSLAFCEQFGGSGHVPAAGIDHILQPLPVVREMMRKAIEREVELRSGLSL
jgi:phosphoesterase RecJ-like protein